MFGRPVSLESLQTRKRLLILASEVHRAELGRELAAVRGDIQVFKEKTKPALSVLKVAGLVMAGLTAFQQIRHSRQKGESFLPSLLKLLAGIGSEGGSGGGLLSSIVRFASGPGAR